MSDATLPAAADPVELERRAGFARAAVSHVLQDISDVINSGKSLAGLPLYSWRRDLSLAICELNGETYAGLPRETPTHPTLRVVTSDGESWYATDAEYACAPDSGNVFLGPYASELAAGRAAREYLIQLAVQVGWRPLSAAP